jgi:Flp pilus assembly protein TadG
MTGRLFRSLTRFLSDPRGGVSAMLALMMIPMIGVFGMGAEASSWYLIQRAAQNAADSSAMAAATNGCDPAAACHTSRNSATYVQEAVAVANQMGFVSNTATTVDAAKVNCPGGATPDCYQVTISRKIPIYLVRVVGFNGDATLDGARAQTVVATAIAKPNANGSTYCLLALGTGTSIVSKGGPKIDMEGCKVATNGSASCSGHDLNADEVAAYGTDSGCTGAGGVSRSGVRPAVTDPYSGRLAADTDLQAKIDAHPCPNYDPGVIAAGSLSLNKDAPQILCGNQTLAGNVNVTTPLDGGIIVIDNGSLIIPSGMTLKTLADSGLTVIFISRTPAPVGATHILDGGGTIDIAAPTEGKWSGVAVYQDPTMTTGVSFTDAGNSPTWNMTGLVYLPHADIQFRGIVNKASNGHDCFALVVNSITSKGTGTILEKQTECRLSGLTPPTGGNLVRQALVQ